jgi:hypothetical protein
MAAHADQGDAPQGIVGVAPFAVLSGEGTPLEIPAGGSVTIKAHTRNTDGSVTVLEFEHEPKAGPALHPAAHRIDQGRRLPG